MILVPIVAAIFGALWCLGMLSGWYSCRRRTKRNPKPWWNVPEPFNWRIFIGPDAYYCWFEENVLKDF